MRLNEQGTRLGFTVDYDRAESLFTIIEVESVGTSVSLDHSEQRE